GSRTVMTGSVSKSKNDPSQSLQMIERPLLTPDELKSLPKGDFVVMKTGVHPMRIHLKLFFKWGIEFDKEHPYTVAENGNRTVEYAEKKEIIDGIMKKYHPEEYAEMLNADGGNSLGDQTEIAGMYHEPDIIRYREREKDKDKKGGGKMLQPTAPENRLKDRAAFLRHEEPEVSSDR
ncbi:MAG: type IV secretory system conjugative DNA transfer family protein, partial [Clostridia bacterium]|nr:type IV secretory system conjugative DNA transfer family protein [Clostridia bacterium]